VVKIYPMKQYKIIGRGKAGWHAEAGIVETGSISGGGTYSTKESSSGGTLEHYALEAVGCLVYDAEGADDNAFIDHVYNGPMVDVCLPAGYYRPLLRESTPALNFILHSCDHVALDIFEGLLRRVPGMKFGRVVKGKVVWE